MAVLSLIVALVALVIAILAFWRAGGVKDLKAQINSLSSVTESLREKTADVLAKAESAFRREEEKEEKATPPEGKEGDG